jgi:hypothetical protein
MDISRNVPALLSTCQTTAELRRMIEDLCAGHGEVLHVTLMCGKQHPGHKTCVVDLVPKDLDVGRCAAALGSRVFSANSIIISFAPHPSFACPLGTPPDLPSCSCTPRG